jgi:hypothetical protein
MTKQIIFLKQVMLSSNIFNYKVVDSFEYNYQWNSTQVYNRRIHFENFNF